MPPARACRGRPTARACRGRRPSIGSPRAARKAAATTREVPIRTLLLLAGGALLLLLITPARFVPRRLDAAPALAEPDSARIMADVRALAAFPTRFAASAETPAVLDWLRAAIAARGLEPREQRFPLQVGTVDTEQVNLYALHPGRDLRKPWLLLIAHYDTVNEGWGHEASSLEDPESPAPGADDNATGVAVLLEVMRLLSPDDNARNVVFLFSAAEEMGQRGASQWATLPLAGPGSLGWVLNVDQVGATRQAPRALQLFSRGPGLTFLAHIRELGRRGAPEILGWRLHPQDRIAKSDHGPFLARGLAAVSMSELSGVYRFRDQGAGDLPELLDPVMLNACARLVLSVATDPWPPPPAPATPDPAPR